jgi:hypothetical protein
MRGVQCASCPRPTAAALPLVDISRTRCATVALLLTTISALRAQEEGLAGRLREVRITTNDVFAATDERLLTQVVNALHWQTRREVVAREIWLRRGDHVDARLAAELERNLRGLGLFSDVTVRLVATGQPGEVDLEVITRDRLTLNVGAGGSYVGGVSGFRTSLGEGNLLGRGDRLVASFAENSEGEYRGSVAFTDLHVLDSWHTATVRASRTDEGDSAGLDVRRPFKHLADPRGYGVSIAQDDTEADYYRGGESVAEVPYRRSALLADMAWAAGSRDARRFLGVAFAAEQVDHAIARGPLAASIHVPGDTWSVFFGPTASWQWVTGYRKVEGLDTLDYVQDLTLGPSVGMTLGARWRDEDGLAGALQPEAGLAVAFASEPLADVFTNLGARGGVRGDDADAVGWNASVFARAFALATELQTFAASCTFDAVEETQDLPRELTLGEDNGLRGYKARLFAGTRRVRTNLEHRFDTGLELATLRFGLIAFTDTGWVGTGSDLGRPWTSAGVGLRIGSKPLLGDGVMRIDVAKPFDDIVDQSDGLKVSVTIGQVFTFGGNASGLGVR